MQTIHAFSLAVSVGVSLAVVVCVLFHGTLGTILTELCGSPSRGRFWVTFGDVALVLATLWFALWFVPEGGRSDDLSYESIVVFVRTLKGATFGLLAMLGVLGIVLMGGITSYNSRARRDASTARSLVLPGS